MLVKRFHCDRIWRDGACVRVVRACMLLAIGIELICYSIAGAEVHAVATDLFSSCTLPVRRCRFRFECVRRVLSPRFHASGIQIAATRLTRLQVNGECMSSRRTLFPRCARTLARSSLRDSFSSRPEASSITHLICIEQTRRQLRDSRSWQPPR